MIISARQHLLFDADDTLWENNIYFERAFEEFVAFLNHEHLTTQQIQAMMDEVQVSLRGWHGYGARAFAHGLRETFRRVRLVESDDPDLAVVEELGLRILDQTFELLPDVVETLATLHPHHDLILITKGHKAEQQAKVERSGIASWFDTVVISDEKDVSTYRGVVHSMDLDPGASWMIGNSPRSDINPALRAGINAIFIPHPRTWHLEHEDVARPAGATGQLVELARFADLANIFDVGSAGLPTSTPGVT